MTPVVGCSVQVRRWFGPVGCARGRRIQRLAGGFGTRRGGLDGTGPDRYRPHIGQPDPGLSHVPVRSPGQSGHSDDRPSLRGPVELLVTIAPVRAEFGHLYPGEDLAR